MCIVILEDERLCRLAIEEAHVLADRVLGLDVVVDRNQLVGVLNAQNFKHLAVQLGQVVNLRRTLGQLNGRLVLHDPLRHGRAVRVGHRDHVHHVVVFLLDLAIPA